MFSARNEQFELLDICVCCFQHLEYHRAWEHFHAGWGASALLSVINSLNSNSPNRCIECRGNFLEWPPRSPDLTSCDFFFRGHVKEVIYRSHPQTLDKLEDSICTAFHGIDERLCRKVCSEAVENRIRLCVLENGEHFENK